MFRFLLALMLLVAPMLASASVLSEEGQLLATAVVTMGGEGPCHDDGGQKAAVPHGVHAGVGCAASCALTGGAPPNVPYMMSPMAEDLKRVAFSGRSPGPLDWPPPRKPPRA